MNSIRKVLTFPRNPDNILGSRKPNKNQKPMETTNSEVLLKCHEYLERQMKDLNPKLSFRQRKMYLMGAIETLEHFGSINSEIADELLLQYCD
jgi:hypothetical protein